MSTTSRVEFRSANSWVKNYSFGNWERNGCLALGRRADGKARKLVPVKRLSSRDVRYKTSDLKKIAAVPEYGETWDDPAGRNYLVTSRAATDYRITGNSLFAAQEREEIKSITLLMRRGSDIDEWNFWSVDDLNTLPRHQKADDDASWVDLDNVEEVERLSRLKQGTVAAFVKRGEFEPADVRRAKRSITTDLLARNGITRAITRAAPIVQVSKAALEALGAKPLYGQRSERAKLARDLNMPPSTLTRRLKELGITEVNGETRKLIGPPRTVRPHLAPHQDADGSVWLPVKAAAEKYTAELKKQFKAQPARSVRKLVEKKRVRSKEINRKGKWIANDKLAVVSDQDMAKCLGHAAPGTNGAPQQADLPAQGQSTSRRGRQRSDETQRVYDACLEAVSKPGKRAAQLLEVQKRVGAAKVPDIQRMRLYARRAKDRLAKIVQNA